jgi:hypothetical protein
MWDSIIEFLEDLIRQHGLMKIATALGGVAGIFAALGFVTDQELLMRAASIFLISLLLLICLALTLDRRHLYRNLAESAEVLDRYGDDIVGRQNENSFEMKEWQEEQFIGKNGDTKMYRWFTLIVGNEPLQTFWHKAEMVTRRSDFKYRKKFRIEARIFDQNKQVGVRLPVTHTWDSHVVRVFVHLDRVYQPGEEVRVRIRFDWPEYTKELIDRKMVDPTEWMFRRKIGRLLVTMIFENEVRIRQDFTITTRPNCPKPIQKSLGRGRGHQIEFSYDQPPMNTIIGFSIERRS